MRGIDVSHWNGVIDWLKVATKNDPKIEFAFIKASTGVGGKDPKAHFNSHEAQKAGLKIGYYHYASLNSKNEVQDAQAEADWFISVIKGLPVPDLPLILDLEDENPKVHLEDDEVLAWVNAFFLRLKERGYPHYALYSYTPFLNAHLPATHGLGPVRLWIAQYNNKPQPTLPKGWGKYWIWQFSCKGKLEGIKGDVDLNITEAL